MKTIRAIYDLEPELLEVVNKYKLSVAKPNVKYDKSVHHSEFSYNVNFTCKLYIDDIQACDFSASYVDGWSSIVVRNADPIDLKILNEIDNLIRHWTSPAEEFNESSGHNTLGDIVVELIKKALFENILNKLKANHILTFRSSDTEWSSTVTYPLTFIPCRYNSKPFSNMSPAERRKWHIQTVLKNIPVFNPEIFTLYKMQDKP
jgi:hypothetical protein